MLRLETSEGDQRGEGLEKVSAPLLADVATQPPFRNNLLNCNPSVSMKEIRISKGNGKYRVVYSPDKTERKKLKKLLPIIASAERTVAGKYGVAHGAHGFIRGRSPVTCARAHIGFKVTISMDLESWFDSVRQERGIRSVILELSANHGRTTHGEPHPEGD
jgi:hypothetical protein